MGVMPAEGAPGVRGVRRAIVLGFGRRIPLGAYVDGIKACMMAPPGTEYPHSLTGWASDTRERILQQWRDSVHDRINIRGGLAVNELAERRLLQKLDAAVKRGAVVQYCRWCGLALADVRYRREWQRFCDGDCRHAAI